MDGRMDGWGMAGWLGGWMDGQMKGGKEDGADEWVVESHAESQGLAVPEKACDGVWEVRRPVASLPSPPALGQPGWAVSSLRLCGPSAPLPAPSL